ncbi:Sialic acid-binding Ig-like lectin 12 [Heterocephalus glaber]|nr:Sialic acid-binding Ig-like lectin 12 [Heterocephalus glaber]
MPALTGGSACLPVLQSMSVSLCLSLDSSALLSLGVSVAQALCVFSAAPTALANGSSLPVVEGQALRLLCAVDSHPRARLSWSWGNLTLCPSEPANPGVLELTPEHLRGEGEFTCRAQNALGSRHVSLSLSLQGPPGRGCPLRLQPPLQHLNRKRVGVAGCPTTGTLIGLKGPLMSSLRSWSWRKKSAKPAASARDPNAASGSVSQGPLVESQPDDSSSHQPLPSVAALSSEEEEEIHYASLSFHGVKPRDPQEHQSITSEYSEIKFHE